MKNLNDFDLKTQRNTQTNIQFVLTDIDDTLTTDGKLPACAYDSLWQLHYAGIKIIPITGRPAGWCEMIARFWPVAGIIGENGGFYFRLDQSSDEKNKKMQRWFFADDKTILENKLKLKNIETEILKSVPGCAVSSDQFSRLMDLAIDFCEDVQPLPKSAIDKIVNIFESHGAIAKVSSIHVNGWFGDYNKVTTTLKFLKNEFGLSESESLNQCVFVGDSPNDEPMFEKFPLTFGVGNLKNFSNQMTFLPSFISDKNGGEGFSQISQKVLSMQLAKAKS